jgi:hypothetical protein
VVKARDLATFTTKSRSSAAGSNGDDPTSWKQSSHPSPAEVGASLLVCRRLVSEVCLYFSGGSA